MKSKFTLDFITNNAKMEYMSSLISEYDKLHKDSLYLVI